MMRLNIFRKKETVPDVVYIDKDVMAEYKKRDTNAKKELINRLSMNKKYQLADYIQINDFLKDSI